ncbi:MAG: peptide chain release factor N(5)-glutamine methyltransferase [Tenericutes bacterium]|nr:peptide chain release factor N(5)-glutamine methyltransferase [Mycoplasmatota bacterium]
MASYKTALDEANKLIRKKGKESSAARLLLLHFSCLLPTELYLNYEKEMPVEVYKNFFVGLNLYLEDNIPVQQIMGYVYFYGYKFIVNNQVLIPRFETEELVVNVLMLYDEYFQNQKVDLVDVGTGSGCLAITLKKEEAANMTVTATDISASALEVAKDNAKNIGVEVEFIQGDMLKPLQGRRFDILVSNPPYIPRDEKVDTIIYDNEPHVALFGGLDGLRFYKEILESAAVILKPKSIIAFEHGYDKADELQKIANVYFPNAKIFTIKDMQKLDRMTFIINEPK